MAVQQNIKEAGAGEGHGLVVDSFATRLMLHGVRKSCGLPANVELKRRIENQRGNRFRAMGTDGCGDGPPDEVAGRRGGEGDFGI